MVLDPNLNNREKDKFFCDSNNDTAVRVGIDPHGAATFQLQADIENGVDISIYMVNDFDEILINNKGQLLQE